MKRTRHLMTITATVVLLCACFSFAACSSGKVTIQPLTPDQQFALAKIGATAAASGLAIRIASLEKNPEKNPEANAVKLRIMKAAKGIIEEFNNQVADITSLDLSKREDVRKAIDKGVTGADNLIKNDVLQLNDPAIQADISAVIAVVKSALKSFDVLFPAPASTGSPQPNQGAQ